MAVLLVIKRDGFHFTGWKIPCARESTTYQCGHFSGGCDINSVGAKIQVFTDSFWPLDTDFGQQHRLAVMKPTPSVAALAQASHFDVKTPLAGEIPCPQCRLRAVTFRQHCRKVCANLLTTLSGSVVLTAIESNKIVRSDFYMDSWQDCRKSTNWETGFGNGAKPDLCCPE